MVFILEVFIVELFLVEYYHENLSRDVYENEAIVIFDSFQKAYDYVVSHGFIAYERENDGFYRNHDFVKGHSAEHTDYAYIFPYTLNRSIEEGLGKHYKV